MVEKLVGLHVQLPVSLWRAAKVRAAADGVKLRYVVMAALNAYLRPEGEGGDV